MTKLSAYIVGGVILAAALLFASLTFDPWGLRKRAETRAVTATQQAAVATKTTEVLDRVVRSEVIIRNQAQGAVEHVEQAQGADQPLPAAVGLAVRAGVDGLRHPAGSGADHAPGEPQSAM